MLKNWYNFLFLTFKLKAIWFVELLPRAQAAEAIFCHAGNAKDNFTLPVLWCTRGGYGQRTTRMEKMRHLPLRGFPPHKR
jgi:hypothetical protein